MLDVAVRKTRRLVFVLGACVVEGARLQVTSIVGVLKDFMCLRGHSRSLPTRLTRVDGVH